jgi:hypothetical protein
MSGKVVTEKDKISRKEVEEYIKNVTAHVMTSRFNNATYEENEKYRMKHKKIGCIYCTEERVTEKIDIDKIMFVLEMNNEKNRIMGIGLLKNRTTRQKHNVYENYNYNRNNYVGRYRIDTSVMTENEKEFIEQMEKLCFTTTKHLKRGRGLQMFPVKTLYKMKNNLDVTEYIRNMFKKRIEVKQE